MIVRKVRPRFRFEIGLPAQDALRRIVDHVERAQAPPCAVMVSPAHRLVELRVLDTERRFWSPALSVTLEERTDGSRSEVRGLIGPNPNVWTLFAMVYMGLWTGLMFAAILGFVQWTLDLAPWGLWLAAGIVAALGLTYGASRYGQRLAAPQTAMLRHVLEDALDLPAVERVVTDLDPYHRRPAGD